MFGIISTLLYTFSKYFTNAMTLEQSIYTLKLQLNIGAQQSIKERNQQLSTLFN